MSQAPAGILFGPHSLDVLAIRTDTATVVDDLGLFLESDGFVSDVVNAMMSPLIGLLEVDLRAFGLTLEGRIGRKMCHIADVHCGPSVKEATPHKANSAKNRGTLGDSSWRHDAAGPTGDRTMSEISTDRDLLFGFLALQMGFITRDALETGLNTCATEKDKSLAQVLQSQGALTEDDDQLLDALVRRLMEKHNNNARTSLAAVTTVSAIQDDLAKIRNHDLSSTIDYAPNAAEETEKAPDAIMPETADATRVGGTRFRLVNFYARGGLGEVWVARDDELNREVALKRIQEKHADSPQSRTRFLHEAEVTGRLEHRGIVPVYGLGHFENGRPYYAMRFVSGTSLKDAIAKFHGAKDTDPAGVDRSLDLRRLLGTFVDVCNTVAYAHSRGVLHRDLKPGNIILDEYGETLVVDWGLAKTGAIDVDSALTVGSSPPVSTSNTPYTLAGTTLGTPGFMSPEQAMGRLSDLSPASDVYSLGATLYCLLTGKTPFDEPDPLLILPKVCAGDFPRPREVKSKVPVALEAICLKAMAVSPEGRYSSARTLGEEIEALASRSTCSGIPRAVPGQGPAVGSPPQAMGCGSGRPPRPDRGRTGDLRLANHCGESADDRSARHDSRRTPRASQGLGGKPDCDSQYGEAA